MALSLACKEVTRCNKGEKVKDANESMEYNADAASLGYFGWLGGDTERDVQNQKLKTLQ